MGFIVKRLLFIGLLGVVLAACSAATDTDESSEHATDETIVDASEVAEEKSIVADEITTTFYPVVTRLRHLTEQDLEWYKIIMTRLNAIDDHSGDRETVYEIAEEYGEDPEDLYSNWLEIVDAKWFGDDGNYAILHEDYSALTNEIIEKNIVGEKIEHGGGGYDLDWENLTSSGNQELRVDGEPHEISYVIEYSDDYKTAELVEFIVNGKVIDL